MSELQNKMVAISKELGFIEFDAKNGGQGYGYASAAGIIRKLNKALAEHGIVCTSDSELLHFSVEVDAKGRPVQHVVVKETLTFRLGAETLVCSGVGSACDTGDKAGMKASTAAYKYAFAHAFTLGWGAEDPEADESVDTRAKETPTGDELRSNIEQAPTRAKLEKFRPSVLAFKGKKGYDELVAAFKTREGQVK